MKVSKQVLTLMVALAAGSAAADSAGTTAGQTITNTATADFTDPATNLPYRAPGATKDGVDSNQVTTTVNPITGFDIVYTSGTDGTSPTGPLPTGYDQTNVLPGAAVTTTYTVVNNSNIDNYKIDFTPTVVNPVGKVPVVKYYPAGTTSFILANEITSVTLANGAQVGIIQVITIPANALPGEVYSASPNGVANAVTTGAVQFPIYNESQNVNPPATTPVNGDLQYTRATVFAPTVVNYPTTPDPTNFGTPSVPTTNTVVPPTAANPGTPNNPVSPDPTPASTDPTNPDPKVPGYTDPSQTPTVANPGTPIEVSGNSQIAYPPADANTTPDSVTFKNVVSTPVLATTPADTVSLFPTNAAGTPIGTNNGNGSFSVPASGTTPAYTITFTKPDGTALPLFANVDGNQYPSVATPAGGGSVPYLTKITYPDSNPNSNTATTDNPTPIVVLIGADSSNDSDGGTSVIANGTTTDSIFPAAAAFGDVPASGTTAAPGRIGPADAAQLVVPGAAVSSGAPSTTLDTDSTAVFPMTINNTGEYADTYSLTGSVQVKLADGTTRSVPVKYVDPTTGAELPRNTSGVDAKGNSLPPFLADGVTPAIYYVTPRVLPNSDYTTTATVDIPAGAAITTGAAGTNPNPLVSQSATGNFSTIVLTDNNDQIRIGSVGGITVEKTQSVKGAPFTTAAANALPKDTLDYKIVAKNNYNGPVSNFKLKDNTGNAFGFTNFVDVNVGLSGFTGTVYYSTNGGTSFTNVKPLAGTDLSTNGIQVAVDNNAPTGIDAADTLPAGASITLTINTTVK